MTIINPIDKEALRQQVRTAQPFPFFCIDEFLEDSFAHSVAQSFPPYEEAFKIGHSYHAVNEKKKVQISNPAHFSPPVAQLHAALADPVFCGLLDYVFDIPNLLADPLLRGGGMHLTSSSGHLDVHVDFNYIAERQLHRRLNILIYLNEQWHSDWGGNLELWDKEVKYCCHSFAPILNRCVVFTTSDISYHGVAPIRSPLGQSRNSFAAYYYTREAPAYWKGKSHSTIFKGRPHELMKRCVLMPLEKQARRVRRFLGI